MSSREQLVSALTDDILQHKDAKKTHQDALALIKLDTDLTNPLHTRALLTTDETALVNAGVSKSTLTELHFDVGFLPDHSQSTDPPTNVLKTESNGFYWLNSILPTSRDDARIVNERLFQNGVYTERYSYSGGRTGESVITPDGVQRITEHGPDSRDRLSAVIDPDGLKLVRLGDDFTAVRYPQNDNGKYYLAGGWKRDGIVSQCDESRCSQIWFSRGEYQKATLSYKSRVDQEWAGITPPSY
jgi:hypothetical protein